MVHCIEHVAGRVHLSQMKIMAMMIKVTTTDTNKGLLFSIFTMFWLCERRSLVWESILDSAFPNLQSLKHINQYIVPLDLYTVVMAVYQFHTVNMIHYVHSTDLLSYTKLGFSRTSCLHTQEILTPLVMWIQLIDIRLAVPMAV